MITSIDEKWSLKNPTSIHGKNPGEKREGGNIAQHNKS